MDGITAIESIGESLQIFLHDNSVREIKATAFVLLGDAGMLEGFPFPYRMEELHGDGDFCAIAFLESEAASDAASKFLKGKLHYRLKSPEQEAMTLHQLRLFEGMEFRDLRRGQLIVYDQHGHHTAQGEPDEDAVADAFVWRFAGKSTLRLSSETGGEKALLQALEQIIHADNPEVIEGFGLMRYDLPLLEKAARRAKIKLAWGRDRQWVTGTSSAMNLAGRTVYFRKYRAFGRQLVDLRHLVDFHDSAKRDLESFDESYLAEYFHLSPPGTGLIPPEAEAKFVDELSATLSPSYFYQTMALPFSYQEVIFRGNGVALDAMFTGEYIRKRLRFSLPEIARPYAGALTEAVERGVFSPIWHCDVRSLYPSILLSENWSPKRDSDGVFLRRLAEFRTLRLTAKDRAGSAKDPQEKAEALALSNSLKLLINSFYGYLGFAQGCFNDYDLAERVTTRGREILLMMKEFIARSGGLCVEMDTDGIYFVPGAQFDSPTAFLTALRPILPQGIDVELDRTAQAMFSYKSKNYALLDQNADDTVELTGAALKSRGMEQYLRYFIRRAALLLMQGEKKQLEQLKADTRHAIELHSLPISDLAKTEVLNDSVANYRKKQLLPGARRSAAYELVKDGNAKAGDRVRYYLTGNKPKVSVLECAKRLEDNHGERDENIPAYLRKLDDVWEIFREFV
ncbi:MAG: DNA polymerase domain-containing protein [Victivallaceae bacterium]|nr:DNA polymerase domain-containing protein [Victivallaceae bacterium]